MVPTEISVYDLSGRLVKGIPLTSRSVYSIGVSELTQGMYMVAISTMKETMVKKFIVDPNAVNIGGFHNTSLLKIEKKVSLTGKALNTTNLSPKEDAYLQGSKRFDTDIVRVDNATRKTYLKYDLSGIGGSITGASLKFTIASDPGSGKVSVYKGNGTNWTEHNLSNANRPSQGALLGFITKSYGLGSVHTITLNKNNLTGSVLSLVVVHSNGNDIDFASKEHASLNPPTLVVNHTGSGSGGGDTSDGNTLSPKEDAYLQGSKRYNTNVVRIDNGTRKTYLKYDLSSVRGSIKNAQLEFTIASDPGSGKISVYKGNGTNWTEHNLSNANKPSQGPLLGAITKSTYKVGSSHSIPLNKSQLTGNILNLIVVHSNGNDIDFASKEHSSYDPPELVINGGESGKNNCSDLNDICSNLDFDFIHRNGVQAIFDLQDQQAFVEYALRKKWAQRQFPILRDEINRQLKKNFSGYNEAQNAYTKNYVENIRNVKKTARDIASSFNSEAIQQDVKQQPFTKDLSDLREWDKLSEWCKIHQTSKCKRLSNTVVRGVKLGGIIGANFGNTRSPKLSRLLRDTEKDFSLREYEAGVNRAFRDGMFRLENDENLVNTFAHQHNLYLNNQDIVVKVFMMAEYLHYTNPDRFVPPFTSDIKDPFPLFAGPNRLKEMGKPKGKLPFEVGIFSDAYVSDILTECARGNLPIGPQGQSYGSNDCNKLRQDMLDLKEQIIVEHLENFGVESALANFLINNPYGLLQIDCGQIENWQSLASHDPPQAIKDKIEDLKNNHEDILGDWNIQYLNEAGGAIVNMDYFAVNITKMPNNPKTDKEFTRKEFLDYFRRNINDFVEGTTFQPYCEINGLCRQETDWWNRVNPLGAIIKLDISLYNGPGGNILSNDGVVMVSEFNAKSYWRFITLEAPYDSAHPVTGTRQFGIEELSDDSFNIYVRGVDRFSSRLQELGSSLATLGEPFKFADNLWRSFQEKTNEFVISNGGNASIKTPIHNRPDWDEVKDVLEGRKPITDLGCN
ncbi:MAG: hypothetical protein Mars2KO_14280 [Maribacter sp.]